LPGCGIDSEDVSIVSPAEESSIEIAQSSIRAQPSGSLTSSLEIMLGGGGAADMRHLTHTVPRVRSIVAKFGPDAREDALEIESEDGDRTILVFETLRELPENL
jgi:hypothetical protein